MKEHHKKNMQAYDRGARGLAATYNGLASAVVLPGLAERLPESGAGKRALDLGCGSGRDAFWLATEYGYEVTAVDGSAAMLDCARTEKAHPRVRYVQDMLPELDRTRATEGARSFDLVVLSAVWMHLQPPEREVLMTHIAAMANKDALVYISLRHGDVPADRPMFPNGADEVARLARRHGARFERIGGDDDRQGRGGVTWEYVALRF